MPEVRCSQPESSDYSQRKQRKEVTSLFSAAERADKEKTPIARPSPVRERANLPAPACSPPEPSDFSPKKKSKELTALLSDSEGVDLERTTAAGSGKDRGRSLLPKLFLGLVAVVAALAYFAAGR